MSSNHSAGSSIRINFFNFLLLGKSRFPPKKVNNIDDRSTHGFHGLLQKVQESASGLNEP